MPSGTDRRTRPRTAVAVARRLREDDGSAVVEFLGLALILLVPVIYLLLFVAQAQAAAFGAVAAADQAAKAAVSQEKETAAASVHAVTRRTLHDYGVLADRYEVFVECHPGDCRAREPGMVAQVRVRVEVPLPVVEQVLGVQAAPLTVSAESRQRVPRF